MPEYHPLAHFPTNRRKPRGGIEGGAPVPTWVRILIVVVPWLLLVIVYYFYTSEPDWDIAIRSPLLFFCFCMFVAAITATVVAVFMLGSPPASTYPAPPCSCPPKCRLRG